MAPFGTKNCCKNGMMNPRNCRCVCAEGRRALTALTGTRTPSSRAARLHPARYCRFVIARKPRTGLSGSPWPVSSWERPGAPALLQNKSQILGKDNVFSQHWHLAGSVRVICVAWGCPPNASTRGHRPYFSPCL